MSLSPTEDASASDNSDTVRVTVSRSKNHTGGGIRRLFREAIQAMTGRAAEPAPAPRRRRGGGTGKAFALAAKTLATRGARMPAEVYRVATVWLSDTLDWLRLWDDNSVSDALDEDYNTKQDHSSPHP